MALPVHPSRRRAAPLPLATSSGDPVIAQLRTELADRYHIERELEQGGMATVHVAQDLSGSRAEARARPSSGVLKDAHASASRALAEPALQSGTATLPGAAR